MSARYIKRRNGRQRGGLKTPSEKLPTPDGPMTRREISAHYKIPFGTVCGRLWQGVSVADMLDTWKPRSAAPDYPEKDPRRLKGMFATPWGMLSLMGVARQIGITRSGLCTRLHTVGMPPDIAFNTPSMGVPGVHFVLPPDEYRRRTLETLEAHRKAIRRYKREKGRS